MSPAKAAPFAACARMHMAIATRKRKAPQAISASKQSEARADES